MSFSILKSKRTRVIVLLSILLGISCFIAKKDVISQNQDEIKSILEEKNNPNVIEDKKVLKDAVALQDVLRKIAKTITPGVVNISSTRKIKTQRPSLLEDEYLKKFFGFPDDMIPKESQSLGSGFIIDAKGYILTNNHVVADADDIVVRLEGSDDEYKAEVIGTDPDSDVALIKIETNNKKLDICPLGDSDKLEVGDFAVAVGNPFGLNGSFTFGVISHTGRRPNWDSRSYIQTDTPINQGNSGGPLINIFGQVVGINTAIYSPSGGSVGIGFAIPINTAKKIATQLLSGKPIERGSIGVKVSPVVKEYEEHIGIDYGAFVQEVLEKTPAASAGIQAGDVIIYVDGEKVRNPNDLVYIISNKDIGKEITLTLWRNGEKKDVKIVISSKNEIYGNDTKKPLNETKSDKWLGLTVEETDEGLLVTDVEKDSEAYKAGLREDDVIKKIGPKGMRMDNVVTIENFKKFADKYADAKSYMFQVKRGDMTLFIVVKNKD